MLSNPINKFIRYKAINEENTTINITRDELSLYSQLEKASESPIKENHRKIFLNEPILIKIAFDQRRKINYTCKI